MDIPFLKLMAEAYVSDSINPLNKIEIENFLLESFSMFKSLYPEMATELYSHTRGYQQDIIYEFLNYKYVADIKEDYDYLISEELQLFKNLTTRLRNAGRALFTNSDDPKVDAAKQFLLSVIEKNYNNCNKLCSPVDIHPELRANLLYKNIDNKINDPMIRKLLDDLLRRYPVLNTNNISRCLRFCYLDYMTTIYAEGIVSYEICTKKLKGTDIRINNYSDILKNYPIDGMCDTIYVAMNELFLEINKLLDIIYIGDSLKKKKWIDVIWDKLSAARSGKFYRMDYSKVDDTYEYPTDYVRIV